MLCENKSGMFINKHNIRITYSIKTKECFYPRSEFSLEINILIMIHRCISFEDNVLHALYTMSLTAAVITRSFVSYYNLALEE